MPNISLRLRAEAAADVEALLEGAQRCAMQGIQLKSHVDYNEFSEPTLTLTLEAPDAEALELFFDAFLDLFDELDDVHVAFETLAVPASAFTGQRDADASAEGHARAFRAALRAQT